MTKNLEDIKQSLFHQRLLAFLEAAPGIVHNLNNPLTIISTRAQLLQMKMPENQDFKKMTEQSKAIEAILNNLVFISQNISNDQLQKIDINVMLKNEMEFLNADAYFKHNITKDFQYYPGPLMTISSYFHISTLLFCVIQVLLSKLQNSSGNKIIIFKTDKSADVGMIIIRSPILFPLEISNSTLSRSSRSDDPHVQNLLDACQLARENEIELMIDQNSTSTEFTISIPIKK